MPLLKPKKDETKKDFISRFMKDENSKKEFPNVKQRIAVAYSQWKKINESINIINERLKLRGKKIVGKGGKILGYTKSKKRKDRKKELEQRRLELMYLIKNKLGKKNET